MDSDAALADFDFALDLFRKRQYRGAMIAFEKVLHQAQQMNDVPSIIYVQLAIGDSYFFLGDSRKALICFNQAHSFAERIDNENLIALSCLKLARSLVQFITPGEVSTDLQVHYYLINALQLFESIKDDLGLMATHGMLGFLERLLGHEEAAFYHFRTASHKALLLKKPDLMTFFRRRAGGEASFPYIFYFPYPKGPPDAAAAILPIQLTCPSCRQPVSPMVTICPFCEFNFFDLPRSV